MLVLLKVKNISVSKYKSKEFALTALYIPSFDRKNSDIYACIKCELHLIDHLKANMLIVNNVLYTKSFSIDLTNASAQIGSCRVDIVISARYHSDFLKRGVLANTTTFIPPKSEVLILFQQVCLSASQNFLFYPFFQQ